MMRSDFDDAVIGNGLLGAAAALELARLGRRVCLVGAEHGTGGRWFSGHDDDSRMLRLHHTDDYWEVMSRLNLPLMRDLQAGPVKTFFTPVTVRLRVDGGDPAESTLPRRRAPSNALLDAFELEDEAGGGIIDPLAYIAAMNAQARSLGAVLRRATVLRVEEEASRCQVDTDQGSFSSARVLHACGFHAAEEVSGLQVIGKVVLFAHRPHAASGPVECFVDAQPGMPVFSDVYGFCDYRQASEGAVTKLGFTETSPVLLDPSQVPRWFNGGYRQHPLLAQMHAWTHEWHAGFASEIRVKPCAFAITGNRRPGLWRQGPQFWLAGCNGMVAKCCQAVARSAVAAMESERFPDFPAELRMTTVARHV